MVTLIKISNHIGPDTKWWPKFITFSYAFSWSHKHSDDDFINCLIHTNCSVWWPKVITSPYALSWSHFDRLSAMIMMNILIELSLKLLPSRCDDLNSLLLSMHLNHLYLSWSYRHSDDDDDCIKLSNPNKLVLLMTRNRYYITCTPIQSVHRLELVVIDIIMMMIIFNWVILLNWSWWWPEVVIILLVLGFKVYTFWWWG